MVQENAKHEQEALKKGPSLFAVQKPHQGLASRAELNSGPKSLQTIGRRPGRVFTRIFGQGLALGSIAPGHW